MRESRYILSRKEREALELRIKECGDSERRIRLLCVYWVGQGKSIEGVSDFFLISVRSVARYLDDYHERNKIDPGQKGGSNPHLNEAQEKELKDYLAQTVIRSTLEDCAIRSRHLWREIQQRGNGKMVITSRFSL